MNQGIIYVVFGEEYDKLAASTVAYSRQFTNLPICILTNIHDRNKKWDQVENVSFVEFDLSQDDNRAIKTWMGGYSPFDQTIYIDCDAVIQRTGIEKIFDLLLYKDIVLNFVLHWNIGEQLLRIYCKAMKAVGETLPLDVYDGAFMAWNKCDATNAFFVKWSEFWRLMGSGRDMPALACALKQSKIHLMRITTEEDKFFVLDHPDNDCIIQHNYNSYQGKDFDKVFRLPRIRENKPFDGNSSDWQMVDF